MSVFKFRKKLEKTSYEILGMTFLMPEEGSNMSYVVTAHYAVNSTLENPTVQIEINGDSYQTHVKQVNPKNASMLEMFALCSYTDDIGISERGTNGSFSRLKTFADHAAANGDWSGINSIGDFVYERQNWDRLVNTIKDGYLKENAYNQYLQCLKLMDIFDYYYLHA